MENERWEKQSTEMEQFSARGNSHAYLISSNTRGLKRDIGISMESG